MIRRPIARVLVASRGEAAASLIAALEASGVETVAVFDASDAEAPHLDVASWAVPLPPSAASAPEGLDPAALIGLALDAGADAIHPGVGPLRAHADAARMTMNVGLAWIGARPEAMGAFADPAAVSARARAAGLPVAGGALGRRVVVAVLGDGEGDGLVLGDHAVTVAPDGYEEPHPGRERDGRAAVREAPVPDLDDVARARLWDAASRFVRAEKVNGTVAVGFVLDAAGRPQFTDATLGLAEGWTLHDDAWGLALASAELRFHAGESLGVTRDRAPLADARDPADGAVRIVLPRPSVEVELRATHDGEVEDIEVDAEAYTTHALAPGQRVAKGDILARVRVLAPTRHAALVRARAALRATVVHGVPTDADALADVLADPSLWRGGA